MFESSRYFIIFPGSNKYFPVCCQISSYFQLLAIIAGCWWVEVLGLWGLSFSAIKRFIWLDVSLGIDWKDELERYYLFSSCDYSTYFVTTPRAIRRKNTLDSIYSWKSTSKVKKILQTTSKYLLTPFYVRYVSINNIYLDFCKTVL